LLQKVTVLFPTTNFDFSSEAAGDVVKTCTEVTNIPTGGISSCTLNKSTNILTVTLGASTTSLAFSFTASSIINPLYAKASDSLTITTLTSANVQIDQSAGTFTVTPTAGALEVTLASATSTVGATESLRFSLALTNTIGTNGKIHILLPKWNPESPSPQSIFSSTAPA